MWRGGLRFASVGDGEPSVVMGGLRQSPLLSVMTSDMNHQMVNFFDFRERSFMCVCHVQAMTIQ